MSGKNEETRRDMLKKGSKAAFVIPVMISAKLQDCMAQASCPPKIK